MGVRESAVNCAAKSCEFRNVKREGWRGDRDREWAKRGDGGAVSTSSRQPLLDTREGLWLEVAGKGLGGPYDASNDEEGDGSADGSADLGGDAEGCGGGICSAASGVGGSDGDDRGVPGSEGSAAVSAVVRSAVPEPFWQPLIELIGEENVGDCDGQAARYATPDRSQEDYCCSDAGYEEQCQRAYERANGGW